MIENPTDQIELYLREAVCAVFNVAEQTKTPVSEVIKISKIAAINILTDTIKHSLEEMRERMDGPGRSET